jgi:4-methylaminobutanoate oxidase (formaldehyde-forming)
VALNKGDFIGREALVKIKEEGPKWRLCSFTIDADEPVMLRGSEPIAYKGKVIGTTTGGGYGYTVAKTIAYGYVPVADAKHDDDYEIEVYKEVYAAKREDNRALYDPERKNILS